METEDKQENFRLTSQLVRVLWQEQKLSLKLFSKSLSIFVFANCTQIILNNFYYVLLCHCAYYIPEHSYKNKPCQYIGTDILTSN